MKEKVAIYFSLKHVSKGEHVLILYMIFYLIPKNIKLLVYEIEKEEAERTKIKWQLDFTELIRAYGTILSTSNAVKY